MTSPRLPVLVALLLSSSALADRRDIYLLLEGGVGLQLLTDAATGARSATAFGPQGGLQFLYGVTNSFHIGAYARALYAVNLSFADVQPTLTDGSTPIGALYENQLAVGGGAIVRWRFDTGYPVAPLLQLELGATWWHFTALELLPTGRSYSITLPDRDVFAPDARGVLGLEVRLVEHLVLELVLGARRALTPIVPWQFDAGVHVGAVW